MGAVRDPQTGLTAAQTIFLEHYEACGVITTAAYIAGIRSGAHYAWMRQNKQYAEAFAEAHRRATDKLEAEARRRAVEGVRKYKFTRNGEPILRPGASPDDPDPYYYEVEYSDRLLELLLRAKKPEEFGHRVYGEFSGPGGGPMEVSHSLRQIALQRPDICDRLADALEHATDTGTDEAPTGDGDSGLVRGDG